MTDRRYSDRELALILKHAAELQEGLTAVPRGEFTLAEIQDIAASAGIDPQHVQEAALSLPFDAAEETVARGATRYEFSEYLTWELTPGDIEEIVDAARREFGEDGQLSTILDSVEWRVRDSYRTVVVVTSRAGRTRLKVVVDGRNLEALIYGLGTVAGSVGVMAVGQLADVNTIPGAIALIVGGAGSAYALATFAWRAIAPRVEARGRKLFQLIARAAASTSARA